MDKNTEKKSDFEGVSRRTFIKASAAAGAASMIARAPYADAAGSDTIRVGLIGCGGRGTGAGIINCAESSRGVELVAIGDLFEDHLEAAPEKIKGNLTEKELPVEQIYKVTPDTMFSGFDAYKKVIACDVDMIILTTPPYFRPQHFRAAVEAGKHVFVEKPIAVDPAGYRAFLETNETAKKKGLTVVAGTQMRRARHLIAVMKQIHKGRMGEILGGQCVRFGGGMSTWHTNEAVRKPEWSDMEWQLRRWLFMDWASGDFIVEQHVHNLDVVNWAMQSTPVNCKALGGRQIRTGPEFGNIYDHFAAEYEYPNDVRIEYMGHQMDYASTRKSLRFIGSKGRAYVDFARAEITGKRPFEYDGESVEPAVQQYADMIQAIRNNEPINDGQQVADATMTAIMGRVSAYTGRALSWEWLTQASTLDLSPETMEFGDLAMSPVAGPGVTELV